VWHRQVHAGYLVVTRTAPGFRAPVARLSHVAPPSTFLAAADLRARTMTIKAALGLPERVQRRLAGKRVTVDGQTLAVDTQLMLRLEKLAREPQVASLPVAEGRRALLLQTVIVGGDQPIGAVRDLPVGDRRGRLFVPSGATARGPLLVFFHGGGWVYGDLDSHDPACRFLAERSGVRVLAVDYRLAPEHPFPAAVDDVWAATKWVAENAAELGADPGRLAIAGDSAGGNLTAVVAQLARDAGGPPIRFQLLWYPATTWDPSLPSFTENADAPVLGTGAVAGLSRWYASHVDLKNPPATLAPARAENLSGLPQAYIAVAGHDPLRDDGKRYGELLATADVPVEVHNATSLVHGYLGYAGVVPAATDATDRGLSALREALHSA
jgi:acetyl esterase